MSLNMKKQWWTELLEIRRRQNLILRNDDIYCRLARKEIKKLQLYISRSQKQSSKAARRLEKRAAILQGRLS